MVTTRDDALQADAPRSAAVGRVVAVLGLACLWVCLQASGFYPLSLVPGVGAAGASAVALDHVAYALLAVAFGVACAIACARLESLLRSPAALRLVAVVVGACGVAGHCLLIASGVPLPADAASPATGSLAGTALAGALLTAAFVAGSVLLWGRATMRMGTARGMGFSAAAFLAAQVLQVVYYGLGIGPAALMVVAPVVCAAGVIAAAQADCVDASDGRGSVRLGAEAVAGGVPADPVLRVSAADAFPDQSAPGSAAAVHAGQPTRGSTMPAQVQVGVRGLMLLTLALIYFCDIFVRLVLPAFSGDAPLANKLATSVAALVVFALVAALLWRLGAGSSYSIAAFALLAVVTMVAMALMLLVEGDLAFVARRMLVGGEHCLEAFVWMALVAGVVWRGPSSWARAFSFYLVVVAVLPWAVSFDAYYLLGLDNALADVSLVRPALTIALLLVALAVIGVLLVVALRSQGPGQTAEGARLSGAPQVAGEPGLSVAFDAANAPSARPVASVVADAGRAAVESALAETDVTPRELDVAALVYRGYSARRIADELSLSEQTVKSYASRVYRKLGIHSKQDLIDFVEAKQR